MMQSYDSWKLDSPEYLSEPDPPEEAVGGEHGIFAWQVFCQSQSKNNVADWAWQACKKGPFITPLAKLIFQINFAKAKLCGMSSLNAARVAGLNCIGRVSPLYLDACSEVQNTWREVFPYYSAKCIQEDDCTINLYLSEIFLDDE